MSKRLIQESPRLSVRALRPYIHPDGERYRLPASTGISGYMETFDDNIVVMFTGGHAAVRYKEVRCRFGGYRVWFCCPACSRSCGAVYLAHETRYGMSYRVLWCRRCAGLGYRSQRQGSCDRALEKAAKLRRTLEAQDYALGTDPPRPKGMHAVRYQRVLARIRDADRIALNQITLAAMGLVRRR
jgi:hypothetical protein